MKVTSIMLSSLFYTVDTYGTFSTDYLDEQWYEESEFDGDKFMQELGELHAEVINDVLPAGPVKSVKLVGTSSPREYNFATDQADLEIDVDLDKLYEYIKNPDNEKEFEKFIQDNFTSCSGFWSWTPNSLRDFYGAVDGTSLEYKHDYDKDKCVAIMAGWYLSREALKEDEYMDSMYDGVNEIMWNCFEQFTQETWNEYDEYEKEFERQKDQLEFPGFPPGYKYLMDIDEWFKEVKEKETADEVSV